MSHYDKADLVCDNTKTWFGNQLKTTEVKNKANKRLVLVKHLEGEKKGEYDVIKQLGYRSTSHDAISIVDYDEYIKSGRDVSKFVPKTKKVKKETESKPKK